MVKLIKNKRAFTVVEILLTLSILGFILLMVTLNARKQLPDLHKARYKKAYLTVEKTVSELINDEQMYPSLFLGLKYLETVVTEFGEPIGIVQNAKFRDAFIYTVDPIKEDIPCQCLGGKDCKCFMTDDGVVYGIPDTDFENVGVLSNFYDERVKYLPITVYTDFEKSQKNNTFSEDAMYIGVQYDGNIKIFHPAKCTVKDKNRYCKAEEYLMSDSIKKEK